MVFVFDPRCEDLLEIFETAPNFKGALTTNPELDYENLFTTKIQADYLIVLKLQDREQLQQEYTGPFEVI